MPFFVAAIWLALLWVLYREWGSFQQSYWAEFLPPLALLAGWVFSELRGKVSRTGAAAFSGLLIASLVWGFAVVTLYPHTGTLELGSLQKVAQEVRENVPEGEEIFTAQPAVIALAQRPIMLGYSHPGWIRAARLKAIPENLRQIYFADEAEITRYLAEQVQFVLREGRTSEIYFDGFPEREEILREQFSLVSEVENDLTEEPFQLYMRNDYVYR